MTSRIGYVTVQGVGLIHESTAGSSHKATVSLPTIRRFSELATCRNNRLLVYWLGFERRLLDRGDPHVGGAIAADGRFKNGDRRSSVPGLVHTDGVEGAAAGPQPQDSRALCLQGADDGMT